MIQIVKIIIKYKLLLVLLFLSQYAFLDFIRFEIYGANVNMSPILFFISALTGFYLYLVLLNNLVFYSLNKQIGKLRIFLLFLLNSLKTSILSILITIIAVVLFFFFNHDSVSSLNNKNNNVLNDVFVKSFLYFILFVMYSILNASYAYSLSVNASKKSIKKGLALLFSKQAIVVLLISLSFILTEFFTEFSRAYKFEYPIFYLLDAGLVFLNTVSGLLLLTYLVKIISKRN